MATEALNEDRKWTPLIKLGENLLKKLSRELVQFFCATASGTADCGHCHAA
jgi:hypothetical protein